MVNSAMFAGFVLGEVFFLRESSTAGRVHSLNVNSFVLVGVGAGRRFCTCQLNGKCRNRAAV